MIAMTDLELTAFSAVHLHYEIEMLAKLGRRALSLRRQPVYGFDMNVLVESYAIHLRSLFDFLYKAPSGDDIAAAFYVNDVAAWEFARGSEPPVLVAARERVGKQIAHLTRRRFTDGAPEKNWHVETEMPALTKTLKVFTAHAAPRRLHSQVTILIDSLPDLWTGEE